MKDERIAIIDCGTNTFHLLIADIKNHESTIVYQDKSVVRIGQGGISFGKINKDASDRAVSALQNFSTIIRQHDIHRVYAYATSAFRSAANGTELTQRIARETGIHITIIDGRREAELIYSGVTYALNDLKETALVVDIGGGSVEFIIGKGNDILWKESFEIGGQRLIDLFYATDPITQQSAEELQNFLDVRLGALRKAVDEHNPGILVGSSGSFETLSEMYTAGTISSNGDGGELPLTKDAFYDLLEKLLSLPREERLKIPGMVEMRVDMIVVASLLIDYLIQKFNLEIIRVSKYALKEGVLSRLQRGKL
ncbi:exopolyphosphatase [Fulvivirga sedimenti]|uniref:Exopolyphosphatase n=1 Tax=Fulvivirga sedimenti TaxID=2879465 RepID=A0A9X1KV17_9BACT|nr:exopolyphosphatase [Fulvivirga sedimenti]MCA6074178.1 exopolyphosphatase [Fulvivirga sedimenti]